MRKPRGKKIFTVTYEHTPEVIQVYFDSEDGTFRAVYNEVLFEDTDASEIKYKLKEELKASLNLTWIPVIQVSAAKGQSLFHDDRDLIVEACEIRFNRFLMAKFPNGVWRKCSMNVEPKDRMVFSRYYDKLPDDFTIPGTYRNYRYLPYSDELWDGLNRIQEGLRNLCDGLDKLLATEEGRQRIIEAASLRRLLEPPQEPKVVSPVAPQLLGMKKKQLVEFLQSHYGISLNDDRVYTDFEVHAHHLGVTIRQIGDNTNDIFVMFRDEALTYATIEGDAIKIVDADGFTQLIRVHDMHVTPITDKLHIQAKEDHQRK